jgi:cytochrome c peroxidase
MKFSIVLLGIIALFFSVALTHQQPLSSTPSLRTKNHFLEQLSQLQSDLQRLQQAAQQGQLAKSQTAYASARQTFKRIEFLVAHLDPQLYERQLNESPLLKPAPNVPRKEIHHPGGLQCIDEQLYGAQVDYEAIATFTENLRHQLQEFQQRMERLQLYDAMVIHAMKEQLWRSFTLGLTGFDTPASSFALQDLANSNRAMSTVLGRYQERFSSKLVQQAQTLLLKPITTNFEAFDRYAYLVEVLIPLLETLETIRTTAALESKEELFQLTLPYQSNFTNPFAPNFLNASYYTKIPAQEQTTARVALGERLFNDPILSSNLQTSCATCHNKQAAFTDQLPFSQNGDQSQTVSRNSPSLNYAVYASAYFYDLRAHDLKNQLDHVVHNHKEFNSTYPAIVKRLAQQPHYQEAFEQQYANYPQPISKASINHALKCYLMSLPSFDAPFDRWVQQKETEIPTAVREGFNLFMGKAQCGTCHFPPTFSGLVPPSYRDSESEILGVLRNENFEHPDLDDDLGRSASGIIKDRYAFFERSFKTVSIRNVQKTAPYMHNGSIQQLETVVEFYNLGGGAGMGLSVPHQTLPADALNLSAAEKKALVAFMEALTDASYQE